MKKNLVSLAMSLAMLMSTAAQAQTTHMKVSAFRIQRRERPAPSRRI